MHLTLLMMLYPETDLDLEDGLALEDELDLEEKLDQPSLGPNCSDQLILHSFVMSLSPACTLFSLQSWT
jgi:hypothetical protein